MWVIRVIGDCPGCGAQRSFGNVVVIGQELLRGCLHCAHRAYAPLPALRKKIIYLDQFSFSHAFGGRDARFVAAADRIKRMTHLQLLVSPYSSVHEDETHQWRGYQDKSKKAWRSRWAMPVRTTCRLIWGWRGGGPGGGFQ